MMTDAFAPELAFYAARVGLAGQALRLGTTLVVALENGPPVSTAEAIAAFERGPKPLRITGDTTDAILRFRLSPADADADAVRRLQIQKHNTGDRVPGIDDHEPDDVRLLVIAFDRLLRVSKGTWRQFTHEFWIDGPIGWSAGAPTSPWAQELGLPRAALRDISMVVLVGYSVYRQLRSPYVREAWGSGLTCA